jgi:hypothetical protein
MDGASCPATSRHVRYEVDQWTHSASGRLSPDHPPLMTGLPPAPQRARRQQGPMPLKLKRGATSGEVPFLVVQSQPHAVTRIEGFRRRHIPREFEFRSFRLTGPQLHATPPQPPKGSWPGSHQHSRQEPVPASSNRLKRLIFTGFAPYPTPSACPSSSKRRSRRGCAHR